MTWPLFITMHIKTHNINTLMILNTILTFITLHPPMCHC